MKQASRYFVALCAIALIASTGLAQTPTPKKALTFNGKVEAVNEAAKSLKMNGEKVEG